MSEPEQGQPDERYDQIWRWITIFRILSMDRVEPWLGELGIDSTHAASWRTAGRQFCRDYFAYADANAVGTWHDYDGWPIEQAQAWLQRALDTAAQLEGVAATASLVGNGCRRALPHFW